jgi:hypothetical protein
MICAASELSLAEETPAFVSKYGAAGFYDVTSGVTRQCFSLVSHHCDWNSGCPRPTFDPEIRMSYIVYLLAEVALAMGAVSDDCKANFTRILLVPGNSK